MDDIDDGPGWEMQMDNERRRFEEEQALLQFDPAYENWLIELAAQAANEQEMKHVDYG